MSTFNIRAEVKPLSTYPKSLLRDLKMLMIDKYHSNFQFIGSSTYRGAFFPSDFDCFEIIIKDDKDKLINFFKKNIQRVVRDLINKKNHFVLEVKMGVDNRYDIDIGECHNNVFSITPDLIILLVEMYDNKLFSDDEYNEFIKIFSVFPLTQLEYEKLKKIIRKHYIIRWTAREILNGFKYLPQLDEPFTIEDALNQKSQINIEVISVVNNKLIDQSNFFQLVFYDKDKNLKVLNLDQNLISDFNNTFVENLKKSIEQLAHSKIESNPMKVAKRLFSLARVTQNKQLLNIVMPIVNSRLGLLYQLKSEISTIIKLLEYKGDDVPKSIIKNQVQNIKYRLSNLLSLSHDELEEINTIINELYERKFDHKLMIEILERIKNKIASYVDQSTLKELKRVGLIPLPPYLLPRDRIF